MHPCSSRPTPSVPRARSCSRPGVEEVESYGPRARCHFQWKRDRPLPDVSGLQRSQEAQECARKSGSRAFLRADAKVVVSTAVWMIPEIWLLVSRIGWYVTSNKPV